MMTATPIRARLPKLHPVQATIYNTPALTKAILAGRSAGKSLLIAHKIARTLIEGDATVRRSILYGTPSQDQTGMVWEYLTTWLAPLIDAGIIQCRQSPRSLTFGSRTALLRTGSTPDTLRGYKPTLVIIDEAAFVPFETYNRSVLGMLSEMTTHEAPPELWLASTPFAGSWMNQLYWQHQSSPLPDWVWWNLPSSANPFITKAQLTRWRDTMSDNAYREEILAEVLVGSGGVFQNLNTVMTAKPQSPYQGQFVAGIDWGDEGDYTVITILDRVKNTMVAMLRMNKMGPDMQYQKAKAFLSAWKPDTVISEHTHFGLTLNQQLRNDGFSIVDFATTGKSKPPLIENLVLSLERGELTLLEDSVLQSELMTFQRVPSATGYQYRAASGAHDDCVLSLAFAWWGLQYTGRSFVPTILEW